MAEKRRKKGKSQRKAPPKPSFIERPGVLERIERGAPLTLVEAPPGFGKTILSEQLKKHFKGAQRFDGKGWMKTRKKPNASTTVLIDDVHTLPSKAWDELKKWLSTRDPDARTILFSEAPAPDELRTILKKFDHHRIGSDRLAFERDEAWEWIQSHFAQPVPEDIVEGAHDMAGGWPTLLCFLIPNNGEIETLRDTLRNPHPPKKVTDFIEKEVWPQFSEEEQNNIGKCAVFRRIDKGRFEALIQGKRKAATCLNLLAEHGLSVERNEETRFLAPLLRESLVILLQRRDAKLIGEAHRNAAEYLRKIAPDKQAPDIVGHLLDAGEELRALQHLEQHADHLAEQVSAERLMEWLSALDDSHGPLPFRSTTLYARVTAALGDWNEARALLKRCEAFLRSPQFAPPEEKPLGYSRVACVRAHMAWLRGLSTEANAYCQRALTALRQAERQSKKPNSEACDTLRLDLLSLQARLLLEAGRHTPAREVLERIVEQANTSERKRAEAHALNDLGTLLMREGNALQAIGHFEKAVPVTDRLSSPDLHGLLCTNLARCHLMIGRFNDARDHLVEALSVRRTLGAEGMAYTLLMVARYHEALESSDRALAQYLQAMLYADRCANMKLRAEALTRSAILLAHRGDSERSSDLLERVQTFLGDLRRIDPSLAALMNIARAAIATSETRYHDAQTMLKRAQEGYNKLEHRYNEAETFLLLGENDVLRSKARQRDPSLNLRRYIEQGCKISNQQEYDFGQPKRFNPILEATATMGGVEAGQHLIRVHGPRAPIQASTQPAGIAAPDAHFRLLSPEGERLISREEVDRLLSALNPHHLNVIQMDGGCEIHHRGTTRAGELKRVILPLMRTLMQAPGENVRAPALAEAIWGEGPYDQRARTRLKVAISRLRTLLGNDAKHLRTIPGKGPQRSANTCYRLETALPFVWIEDVRSKKR